MNGITSHRGVVKSDIKLAAKIIQNLDSRWGLWILEEIEQPTLAPAALTSSSNPVLRNITDYLIEEASAEEDELLKGNKEGDKDDKEEDKSEGETIERDETLIKV